jgi:hypothetical protein
VRCLLQSSVFCCLQIKSSNDDLTFWPQIDLNKVAQTENIIFFGYKMITRLDRKSKRGVANLVHT